MYDDLYIPVTIFVIAENAYQLLAVYTFCFGEFCCFAPLLRCVPVLSWQFACELVTQV